MNCLHILSEEGTFVKMLLDRKDLQPSFTFLITVAPLASFAKDLYVSNVLKNLY